MNDRTLVVGIGSPHGDDRVGWVIAEQLADRTKDRFVVRCARSPAELLDWLEGVVELHVCDAFAGHAEVGAAQCWQWPSPEIATAHFYGSHDFSLPAALALAERLGSLPARVCIWGIAIDEGRGVDSMSPAVQAAVPGIIDRIVGALAHA